MASTASVPEVATSTPAVKVPLGSLLVVCVVAVVLAIGGCAGVLLYLAKHGKLGAASSAQPTVIVEKVKEEAVPTKNVMLEPMLVNLADEDGHSYLRLSVVLAEEQEKDAKKEEKPEPGANAAVRDAVLSVLGKKHAAELLAVDGKDALKKELKAALTEQVATAKVQSVYFTDFLVQR